MKKFINVLIALFVVGALAYLNIVFPKPQAADASRFAGTQEYACGSNLTVVLTPGSDSACNTPSGYASTMKVTAKDGSQGAYAVHWKWASFWCSSEDPHAPCLQNEVDNSGVDGLTGNNSANVTASSKVSAPKGDFAGMACGYYQNDFAFYVTSNDNPNQPICGISIDNPGQTNNNAAWCHTGTTCQAPATHSVCQDNACVKVNGAGTSTCTQNADCQTVQHHNACVNNACTQVTGAGDNSCTTNADCTTPTHKTCQNNACTVVSGAGHNTCSQDSDCSTAHLTVVKIVNNNHGGTKTADDFTLRVNNNVVINKQTYTETPGDYTVSEDPMDGYHQVSISGSCDANGHVHLNNGDNDTCVIENEDNGGGSCTMPSCNTNISGCSYPYPDTKSCSCGPLVCITQTPSCTGSGCGGTTINITNTNTQQQQQQQAVLAASVAPAVSASSLPSTGAGAEVLLTLVGLLPVGFKLRKLV